MTSKTHIASGIMAALAYTYLKNDSQYIILLTGSVIGALIPDIDNRSSTLSKNLPIISKPWAFLRKKAKKLRLKKTGNILEHRGFTHSLLFLVFIYVIFYYFDIQSTPLSTGILIGIFSHIAVDMLNDRGVPLFAPIFFVKINIATITTGKKAEKIFLYIVWIVNLGLIYLNIKNYFPFVLP
jgi:inner membrane protein